MVGAKRKVTVLLVAVMLIFTAMFAGCGTANRNTAAPSSSAAAATESTQASAQPSEQAEEPVVLTILAPAVNDAQVGVQDDAVAKEIEKVMGVRMDITPANAVNDINAKLAAMIASDDLADIDYLGNNDLMQSAVTAQVLLPLDDLIEKYGQDLKKNVPMMLKYSKSNQSVGKNGQSDGKTYVLGGFPVGTFGPDSADSFSIPWVRWDLYKKLGYPKVDSIDDYISLMKQLVALEPTTPDGKKTYGAGAFMGDSQWNGDYVVWASIPFIYGYTVNTYTSVVDLISNDFINFLGDPDSKFYVAAAFWNRLYREGLLDPESFTMKKDDYIARVTQGRYLFSFGGQYTLDYNSKALASGEKEKFFVQLPPPKDTKAVWVQLDQPVGTPTNGVGIAKKCQYPDKAFKLLNYFGSLDGSMLLANGVEGQTWQMVDGKPALMDGIFDRYQKDENFLRTTGAGKYDLMMFMFEFNKIPEFDNSTINLYSQYGNTHPDFNPAEQDEVNHYGITKPLDLITRQAQITASAPENALIPALPKDIQDMANNVDKFAFDNYIKMILAKSESDYEAEKAKFMEGAKQAGNDTVVKWYQDERVKAVEAYNKIKAGN